MWRTPWARALVLVAGLVAIVFGATGSGCPQDDDDSSDDDVGNECDNDVDGDGYVSCEELGVIEDCDDSDAAVNPGAAEIVGDGLDNNCNGEVDEGGDDDVDDDSDDDDTDDDGTDDDTDDDCDLTENEICSFYVNDCGDPRGYGTVDSCEAVLDEDCAEYPLGDVEGYHVCLCDCLDADPTCSDGPSMMVCDGECSYEFCMGF